MDQFEIVQLYIYKGAQPDVVSLHHAAARNHTEVMRFLLTLEYVTNACPANQGTGHGAI
jgi:hypothetical protein